MKTFEEFRKHGGPLRMIRKHRNRWECIHADGWRGGRWSIENALYTFCGPRTRRDRQSLWTELRQAIGDCGQLVFPPKHRIDGGRWALDTNPAPPVVLCVPRLSQWVIQECPFCGLEHYHGAGRGHRAEHCRGAVGPLPGYTLESGDE